MNVRWIVPTNFNSTSIIYQNTGTSQVPVADSQFIMDILQALKNQYTVSQFLSTLQIKVKRIPLCKQLRLPLLRVGIHGTILEVPLTWCPIDHRGKKTRPASTKTSFKLSKFVCEIRCRRSKSKSFWIIHWLTNVTGTPSRISIAEIPPMTTLIRGKNDQPVRMGFLL